MKKNYFFKILILDNQNFQLKNQNFFETNFDKKWTFLKFLP